MTTTFFKTKLWLGAALCCVPMTVTAQTSDPVLDDVFGDHMVLQRGMPVHLRGSSAAGESLTVALAGNSQTVQADTDGRWAATFPAIDASAPVEIKLNGQTAAQDILLGDVFLCSGQSNMEYPVQRALNPGAEIGAPHDSDIRLLTVPKGSTARPQLNFDTSANWDIASSETVPEFSAVCYFTAKNLKPDIGVPIGLIDSTWGGTRIESWMSEDALRGTGERTDDLDLLSVYVEDPVQGLNAFSELWQDWWRETNPDSPDIWANPDTFDWSPLPAFADWKSWNVPALADYNGRVWYRSNVNLDAESAKEAQISLGSIDEIDLVWINGQFIGSQFNWGGDRTYSVPAGVLKDGENEIIVSVLSSWHMGGMMGPADALNIELENGTQIDLKDWTYRIASTPGMDAPKAPWESVTGVTGIGKAMLAPLREIGLKGALWYQGESNAGNAEPYERLLTGLLGDWQNMISPGVKTLIIQLPEFGAASSVPTDSEWAELREAQRRAAAAHEDAALVVTLGAGDPYDIHPPNKQEVARRAADAARALFYGEDMPDTNRDPVSANIQSGVVTVALSSPDRTLQSLSASQVFGTELCDDADCRFVVADIDGNTLRIEIPNGFTPSKVRYNWADTPYGNLADVSGRPVGSFEIAITE